jgi:hypothetical protein
MPPIAIAHRFAAIALGGSLHYLKGGVRRGRNAPSLRRPPISSRGGPRTLFGGLDWQARLAAALGVDRDTVRQWQRPRSTFGPGHPVWDDLLALVSRRRAEVVRAEEELRKWLRRNRGIPPDRE